MRLRQWKLCQQLLDERFIAGLNTLWVDKNLKMHGLIQAFSRTNRILNSIKTFGNIVCFRNLQKRVDDAIALFGDKQAGGIVLLRSFQDYFSGYTDDEGAEHPGYETISSSISELVPFFLRSAHSSFKS